MKCWICKRWHRHLTRMWIDKEFHNVCERCRTTRVERDPKPYGETKTIPV